MLGCFTEVPQYAPSDVIIKTKMNQCGQVVGWCRRRAPDGRAMWTFFKGTTRLHGDSAGVLDGLAAFISAGVQTLLSDQRERLVLPVYACDLECIESGHSVTASGHWLPWFSPPSRVQHGERLMQVTADFRPRKARQIPGSGFVAPSVVGREE